MRRLPRLAFILILLGFATPVGEASSERAATDPTVILSATFETIAPAGPFDFIMQVFEQEPGAWAPPHTHASVAHLMVLEGEFTNIPIVDGQKLPLETYRAGDTIIEPAWAVHEAGNLGGVPMRYLSPRLQPRDAPVTIALPMESSRPGAPAQRAIHRASTEVVNVSGAVDLHETWWELAPGARAGAHFHPGVELGIVTEGEVTLRNATGTTIVHAGESFVNGVGEIHTISNATDERARFITTHVVASGRPLTFAAE